MKRRQFFLTSAGFGAVLVAPGIFSCSGPAPNKKAYDFKVIDPAETLVPVMRVTPGDGEYTCTYYDVCSFSPSGRYLSVTKFPQVDHIPQLGDGELADVCVIDLKERTIDTLYSTQSWGFQVGANIQWGATDKHVYTNDVIDGTAVCVRIDRESGDIKAYSGPMYHISPDESCVAGFPLELMNFTQQGYGVPSRDRNHPDTLPPGAATDQGIWKTDLATGKTSLLVSLADVAAHVREPAPRDDGTFYFWHTKFNLQGTRVMQVLRCLFPEASGDNARNAMVFTYNPDGSDIQSTPSWPIWGHMGGHPNWHPDGEHLIRNLYPHGESEERFCKIKYDGSEVTVLSEKFEGGGHPTVEPSEKFCITDSYPVIDERQFVNIRWIDLKEQKEYSLCKLKTIRNDVPHIAMRLDGHPFWDKAFRKVGFQAAPDGNRQIFVADVSSLFA